MFPFFQLFVQVHFHAFLEIMKIIEINIGIIQVIDGGVNRRAQSFNVNGRHDGKEVADING